MISIIFKGIKYDGAEISRQIKEIKIILAGLGLEDNRTVALYMKRNVRMMASVFALYDMGIPFVPLDINAPEERNRNILQSSEASYILTNTQYKSDIVQVIDINTCSLKGEVLSHNNTAAYIIPTSGTTGVPKLVETGRQSFDMWMEDFDRVISEDYKCTLCMSDYTFDMFMIESLYARHKGMNIILAGEDEQKNPIKLARMIRENNVDFIQATPSRIRLIGTMDRNYKCLKGVKCISLGGEIIGAELLGRLQSDTECKIINIYGPTETTVCCICGDVTEAKEEYLGEPLSHSEVYLFNENMEPVSPGEQGEICVAGKCIALGYKNNSEAEKSRFIHVGGHSLYKTGDMAYINDDGMYVYTGRKDNQIKLRGYRIELEEIEQYIMMAENVDRAVVCMNNSCVNDRSELIAYYTTRDGKERDSREFIRLLKEKLPEYMIPYKYIRLSEFPMTPGGKTDRLRISGGQINVCGSNHIKDKSVKAADLSEAKSTEDIIIGLICKKTEESTDNITSASKLSELGLDSLSYMELVVEIEELYGFEFDDDKLAFKDIITIKDLAEYVKEKAK